MKDIYFCVDENSFTLIKRKLFPGGYYCHSYERTECCIKDGGDDIITNSLAHLSFDLIKMGYNIYLCYNDKKVKVEPHMDLSGIGEPCKDLRFGHNIFKLFRAGIFNELLGIK